VASTTKTNTGRPGHENQFAADLREGGRPRVPGRPVTFHETTPGIEQDISRLSIEPIPMFIVPSRRTSGSRLGREAVRCREMERRPTSACRLADRSPK